MSKVSQQVNMRHRSRKRAVWKRIVSSLAVVVVFCTVYALVLPAITLAEEPICGQQAHEHTDACYRTQIIVDNCAAAAHVHDESCAGSLENPACGFGERILHTHAENCYDAAGTLICQLPELQEHIHEETATDDEPCCELEQVADHVHTDSCFDEEGKRICGLISGVPHVHDDTCFTVIRLDEPELLCSLPEHIHVDACYLDETELPQDKKEFYCEMGQHTHTDECCDAEGVMICTIPEHTHDVSCKVPDYDPEANVETAEDWEAAIQALELTGRWSEDLLLVAQSQLDYRESKQNVILLEDGTVKGYTRYGEWFGAPYIDWSAAFVSFCVHYAGIDGLPQDSSCESYLSKLKEADLLRKPMDYLPKPGDLVLLDSDPEDEDTQPNRMGIVAELLLSDEGELTTLKVLVGDADDEVKYLTYDLLSPRILGYGETPSGERQVLVCDQDHEHTEDCYGYRLYYTDDTMNAKVVLQGVEALPQGVVLKMDRVTAANNPAHYSAMLEAVNEKMLESPYYTGEVGFYSMELLLDGESYPLPDTARTRVEVSFNAPVFTPEAMEGAAKVETFQLIPDEAAPAPYRLRRSATLTDEESAQLYQVEQVQEDTFENASDGLTGLSFESNTVSTFAVVLSNRTKTGVFWERVFDLSEIESGETYMIVSSEGNYALRGVANSSYTAVQIQAQKGEEYPDAPADGNPERNTRYYTITTRAGDEPDNNHYWTLTKSGNYYRVYNQGRSNYLNLNNSLFSNNAADLTFTYKMPEQGWRISNGTRYLRNQGSGAYAYGTDNDGTYSNKVTYYYSRDMLLFKLSDVTELKIPDDVEGSGSENMTTTMVTMVKDVSNLKAGDQIIIAALNQDYAMSTNQSNNNRGRVAINKLGDSCVYSENVQLITLKTGTATGSFGLQTEEGYLYASSSFQDQLKSTSTLNANGSWTITINKNTGEASFTANGSNRRKYMRYNSGSGIFTCYSSASSQQPLCIYKIVSGIVVKPDYGEFLPTTDGLQGNTALTQGDVTIKGQYWSDPATSDIETQFRQPTYEDSQTIDGKVVTDKSVIYGKDDYGAFESYDANTFSVALSALGQEYEIPYVHRVRTPVDVVFVLDVSGSMSSHSTSNGENPDRVIDLCEAVNAAMAQIMSDHEENRVGISIYSSGAWEMLPLDRYTANNNKYLVTSRKSFTHNPTGSSFDINHLLGASSLKNDDGKSFANAGSNAVQGVGTYTQAGIAVGNEIFEAIGTDTTYTATVGEGDLQRTYTVKRQPVFILVSDGEPTHSTSVYNDVLKGPHYGSGVSDPSSNGKGIHGYYTVLSANYYKRAVSIQYQKEALFYSIGMGIYEDQDGPLAPNGKTGDNYKRAVLNPDLDTIAKLTSTISAANTTEQLKNMLQSTYTNQTVQVSHTWPETWYGVPHANEPVLQPNPYEGEYDYADGAYFGDLPESELKEIFEDIYQSSMTYHTYGFVLYKNSSVDIFDHIGKGMEIKGTPVLRYGGVNHTDPEIIVNGNVTTYVYEGIYADPYIPDREVDLSDLSVTVTRNPNGTQTVEMYIEDAALPTYTPELFGREFYYEQLPVRLIYQVGLTEASKERILKLNETGGELVFYTNQWQDDEGFEDDQVISTAVLLPSTANPFYYRTEGTEVPYRPHHTLKSAVLTGTVDYHVDCRREIEEQDGEVLVRVVHKQGNNGKLVFRPEMVDIPLEKHWGGGIFAENMNPVDVNVYKVTDTVDDNGKIIRNAEIVSTVTLSDDTGWRGVAGNLPVPETGSYYAVAEVVPTGYLVSYDRPTVSITTDGTNFFDAVVYDHALVKIPVEKQWPEGVDPTQQAPVNMVVYTVTSSVYTVTQNGGLVQMPINTAKSVATVTLSAENGWKTVLTDLPKLPANTYYVIAEELPQGQTTKYPGITISVTTDEMLPYMNYEDIHFFDAMLADTVYDSVSFTNDPAMKLPSTGGGGTQWYTLGGLLLMAAAAILWYCFYLPRRREERASP